MNTHIASRNPQRQRGAATLVIAMILLFGVTLVVLFTAGGTYMEIRMSANEVRARQAFAEAQGALDFGIAQIQNSGVPAPNPEAPTALSRVIYLDPDAVPDPCPDAPGNLTISSGAAATTGARTALIFACGWSDDASARKAVMQQATVAPALANPPQNPLVAKGTVDVTGAMTVYNYYTNATVWSGEGFNVTSATGKTAVRAEGAPEFTLNQAPPDPPGGQGCGGSYRCTSDNTTVGPDVNDNDLRLFNLSNEDYFVNFFGATPDAYKQRNVTLEADSATANATLDGVTGEVIWVDGDTTIQNADIGTRENPVILIIDGDLTVSGNATIFGVVFVMGDLAGNGGPGIYGSMLVRGTTTGMTGNAKIIFDPVATGGASRLGHAGGIPGTWRDWFEPL